MNKFELEIVTPLGVTNHDSVNYIRCPGLDGSFGVMANHQEGMFALDIGEVKISSDKSKQYFATGGGFAEIINGKVNTQKFFTQKFSYTLKANKSGEFYIKPASIIVDGNLLKTKEKKITVIKDSSYKENDNINSKPKIPKNNYR